MIESDLVRVDLVLPLNSFTEVDFDMHEQR